MNERDIRTLYKGLDAAMHEFGLAQILGERACPEPMLDLAQKVIRAIESLPPEAQRRFIKKQETAEAFIEIYGPEPEQARPYSLEQHEHDVQQLMRTLGY